MSARRRKGISPYRANVRENWLFQRAGDKSRPGGRVRRHQRQQSPLHLSLERKQLVRLQLGMGTDDHVRSCSERNVLQLVDAASNPRRHLEDHDGNASRKWG